MKKSLPTKRTKLRGYFHQQAAPLAIAAGIVLICLSPSMEKKVASAVYLFSSAVLFTMSAVYHSFDWSVRVKTILRKIDHANVFLLIAGTNTPIIVSYMPFSLVKKLLIIIWLIVLAGVLMQTFWVDAPRPLQVSIYITLGVAGFIYMPYILSHCGRPAVITCIMIATGGFFYILGAIFYAIKVPGRDAKVFGFHELFHACTVLGYACHCVGVYFAVLKG